MSVSRTIEGVCFIRRCQEGGALTYWCPGCQGGHTITFGAASDWTWDGNADAPTISPSVLSYAHQRSFDENNPESDEAPAPWPQCHAFVRGGKIEYLSDSGHALAGQTVDMVPLPERYAQFLEPDE